MSDTPRTDAAMFCPGTGNQYEELVDADFARQLERELTELRESLAYAIGEADSWLFTAYGREKVQGSKMDKARRLATATPTPPPLSPATPATVPAEPGSTPPADR